MWKTHNSFNSQLYVCYPLFIVHEQALQANDKSRISEVKNMTKLYISIILKTVINYHANIYLLSIYSGRKIIKYRWRDIWVITGVPISVCGVYINKVKVFY